MEGHIQYGFMNIYQIEKFYSAFFPNWKKEPYFELMSKLDITETQKISTMSCGQRSQVALGLILAQDPDLMILDDYSMGLDAGYRRLFLDYLHEYAKSESKTIFITSHIIQDLENLIDDFVILDYRSILLSTTVKDFKNNFKQYKFETEITSDFNFSKDEIIRNFEVIKNNITIYSFSNKNEIENYLASKNIKFKNINEIPMSLEDAFVGITGKY
jgi:ABC-2 type transport system ATP-binding protein